MINCKKCNALPTTYVCFKKWIIFISSVFFIFGEVNVFSATYNEKNVQFENNGVKLAGTLILPDTAGPHPAIVIVHGSGASDRHNWEKHTKHFPSNGIAILRYDKRGVGASTGSWLSASPSILADDVLAGVHFLQKLPNINPEQVGIWGGSQGWTIGALAAARSKGKVAFAIIISGDPKGQWEQEKYRVRALLRQDNASNATRDRVEKLLSLMETFFKTGEGSELREVAATPDYKKVLHYAVRGGVLPPDNHPAITWWRLNYDFSPLSIVQDIKCPVLSIWGEKDFLVNSQEAASLSTQAFNESGHNDYTWKIFPDADHGLYLRNEAGPGWAKKDQRLLAPEFVDLTTAWLLKRVTVEKDD
ncbi:MAG: alpha/beta hydrolase [Proteobacteria bacterium]|nr:alpha/beta hydrolase [Pseudomonadota bacterium]